MEHVQPINGKYAVYLKEGQPVQYSQNNTGIQFWSTGHTQNQNTGPK